MSKPLSLLLILFALVAAGCASVPDPAPPTTPTPKPPVTAEFIGPIRPTDAADAPAPEDDNYGLTPEPDPTVGPPFTEYTIKSGDTLGGIAEKYDVNQDDIMQMNGLSNADSLQIGQVLRIPVEVDRVGPSDRLIPDSELVYGPSYEKFDVKAAVEKYNGYLMQYQERVEGTVMDGPQIIQLVAERFSVGPRVLLTILEQRGGWVTSSAIGQAQVDYPMGYPEPSKSGLYKQAFWVASFLNEGYYGRIHGTLTAFEFRDRRRARLARVNAGTAAIQNAYAHETTWDEWQRLLGPDGFAATYRKLFGDPFSYEFKPLVPANLKQPNMRLPWEDGHLWYFTGGPHAGWVEGSAWAAVDFTPKDQAGSCWTSADWAIAAAPGKIIRSELGRVVVNLSGSDFQGKGWSLLYMHMAEEGRAALGAVLKTGDHIGHPSCEGGAAETSHLHFARLYNGQWIPAADPKIPLELSGYVFEGMPQEYDGKMVRGSKSYEADNAQVPEKNGVIADGGK